MKIWFCLAVLALAGCVSAPQARRAPDGTYVFQVEAAKPWQDSGVPVRQGHLIRLEPEGRWGDRFGQFGPAGNPQIVKDHHLVAAPAYALLMKISCETNLAHLVAGPTNIVATRTGTLQFRANISLAEDASGTMRVAIATFRDSDGDRLSDEDERAVWKTDPFNPDTDGNGFTDFEDAQHTLERRRRAAERRLGP
jgi:hypothetical protein